MRMIINTNKSTVGRSAHRSRLRPLGPLAMAGAIAMLAAGCSAPATDGTATSPDANTTSGTPADKVVVLDNNPLGTFNPVNNHGRNGESKIYQGLFRIAAGEPGTKPELVPLLATSAAVASDGNRTWTVTTREGVTFSDGTDFSAEDVAVTYQALINPAVASTELVRWQNLESVEATDAKTVVFHLKDPSPEFDRLLLTGIAPSERLDAEKAGTSEAVPAKDSSLNTDPVGTGPYELTELRADQAIFTARDGYWGEKPLVKTIVVRQVEDENTRAQQLQAGEGDGTLLDARLAAAFENNPDFTVTSRPSADWHAITLPAAHPFVGNPDVRLALNLAVDRQAIVDGALSGHGVPNSTFLAPFYGDAYDPQLEIDYDVKRAEKLLDDAGWVKGSDGTRAKDGQRAEFDLIYFTNVGESRKVMALATATELAKIGVVVNPVAKHSADVSDEDYRTTPLVLGGGSQPYALDAQIYTILHSKYAVQGVGAKWDNASDYVNPAVDAALDAARVEADPDKRNELYKTVQKEYAADPAMLQLAYVSHVYVSRNLGYEEPGVALEPHSHGVEFGPWYTIADWKVK